MYQFNPSVKRCPKLGNNLVINPIFFTFTLNYTLYNDPKGNSVFAYIAINYGIETKEHTNYKQNPTKEVGLYQETSKVDVCFSCGVFEVTCRPTNSPSKTYPHPETYPKKTNNIAGHPPHLSNQRFPVFALVSS